MVGITRLTCDRRGKLLQHFRPAEIRTLESLIPKRLREIEARVFEENARAIAIWFEPEAHPRVDDGPRD